MGYQNGLDLNTLPSSGVLSGKSRYYYADYKADVLGTPAVYERVIFSSQPVIPASSNQGTHVGYSEVVEKRSDGSFTRYTYTNFDTGQDYRDEVVRESATLMTQRILYQPFASAEETRGKLRKEELYTVANKRVKLREIEYTAFNKATEFVRAVHAVVTLACPNTNTDGIQEGTSYRVPTYSFLPVSETETLYDAQEQLITRTTTTTTYDPSKLVASTTATDSRGRAVTTTYRYPINFPNQASSTHLTAAETNAIFSMRAKNMCSYPLETTTTRNGLLIGAKVQTYAAAGLNNACILPYRTYQLEPLQPLAPAQYTTQPPSSSLYLSSVLSGAQMRLKATCTLYDTQANLLSLVGEGGHTSSFLWGYNKSLPIAKIENAEATEVFHCNFEEPVAWDSQGRLGYETRPYTGIRAGAIYTTWQQQQEHAWAPSLTIASRARKFIFSGWVYSDGPAAQLFLLLNKSTAQRTDGTVDYYNGMNAYGLPAFGIGTNETGKWVYLEKEVDIPAGVTMLNLRLTNYYNGASAKGGGTWFDDVRLYPADAQMTTYTHVPGLGVTSISDINSRPTYYDLDALGRLSIMRDQNRNILKQYEYHYRSQ